MIRPAFQLKTCCKRILNAHAIAPRRSRRLYSSQPDTSDDTKEMFWEPPETSTDADVQTTKKSSAATQDFKDLLDSLFDRTSETSAVISSATMRPPPDAQKWSGNMIERRLREMVSRSSRTYQEKGPLPRGLSAPLYGKHRIQQARSEERSSVERKVVVGNSSIMARDKEIQTIDAILETKTSYELLQLILHEIYIPPETVYPSHYARALTKSIEHSFIAFGDPYLSMTIFEQSKTKSIESYVSGCTIDVYNAMLKVRWQSWRDVIGMMNLVDEMTVNGVEYDDNTRRIVRSIVREVEGDSDYSYSDLNSGLSWSTDERRAVNTMKALVGKWMVL